MTKDKQTPDAEAQLSFQSPIPISQQEYSDDPNATSSSGNYSPIMYSQSRGKSLIKRYRLDVFIPILIICVLFTSVILDFVYTVYPNLGDSVSQGIQYDVQDISLVDIEKKTKGLILQVKSNATNNYDLIEDNVSQMYFKTGGFVLRDLQIKIDSLDLLVFDAEENDFKNLGQAVIEPFKVDIVNHHKQDLINDVTLYPNSDGVWKIIKRVISSPDSTFKLRGDAKVSIYMINGYVPAARLLIPLDVDLPTGLISDYKKLIMSGGF